jgi:hypothetical protein
VAGTEIKISKDQKKIILAIGLGMLAVIALWWTFFGFGSKPKVVRNQQTQAPAPPPTKVPTSAQTSQQAGDPNGGLTADQLRPVDWELAVPSVADARRNVFAYYVPPTPTPTPLPPPPSPPPPPPILLAAVSPANVYARTADFSLDVTGDKFTPAVHIVVDGRELPTRYKSPQQLSATIPAAMIANPGQRTIIVKTSDGILFSNQLTMSVTAPPVPNYTYVGVILKPRHIGDIAILQDKASKETLNVQRGDLLGGRFRVASISEREVVLTDTNLLIKHPLALSNDGDKGFPTGRPTPRVVSEDDEP